MVYWLLDACKLGAFCCHCILNGDQCFYKRIEQEKSFKKFGMWFWLWNLIFFPISEGPGYYVAKEAGLIDADLLQGCSNATETVK